MFRQAWRTSETPIEKSILKWRSAWSSKLGFLSDILGLINIRLIFFNRSEYLLTIRYESETALQDTLNKLALAEEEIAKQVRFNYNLYCSHGF